MQGDARKGFHKGDSGTKLLKAMRKPRFIPVETTKGWLVNIPPNLSTTGTRQRRYFRKKSEAEGFVAKLNVRREIHGPARSLLTPAQEEQAAAAFNLLAEVKLAVTLAEITGQYLARN